jgi:peptide/nickel transport system permease protein
MAFVGAIILFCITVISVCAPLLTDFDPAATDLYHTEKAPDDVHILGTDKVGHDVYARLLYGGRISLMVGVMTMVLTILIGGTLGAISGYYGGKIDMFIMRVTDVLLTLPTLLMILFLVSILDKTNEWLLIITLGLTAWSGTARLVRGEFLSLREREYVLSARAIGCSDSRIMFKHILLNTLAPLTVSATLLVGNMILVESALSYLGFGVPQTTPTWGNMLNAARNMDVVSNQPWVWIPPGMVIIITVLAINFIGDGLRDAFDTRSTKR